MISARNRRYAPLEWSPTLTRVRYTAAGELSGRAGTFVRNSYPLTGKPARGWLGVLVRFDGERDLVDVDPYDLTVICERDPFAAIGHKLPTRYAPGATGTPYDYPGDAGTWYPVIYYSAGTVEEDEGPIWLVEPYPAERADGTDGLDPIDSAGVAVLRCDAAPRPRGTDPDGDWVTPGRALARDCAYDAYVTNQRDLLAAWVEAYAIAAALNNDVAGALHLDPEDIEVLLAAERRDLIDAINAGPNWRGVGAKDTEVHRVPVDQFSQLRGGYPAMIAAVRITAADTLYGLTGDGAAALARIRDAGFSNEGLRCRVCGCTGNRACDGGCQWTSIDWLAPLCSACPSTHSH